MHPLAEAELFAIGELTLTEDERKRIQDLDRSYSPDVRRSLGRQNKFGEIDYKEVNRWYRDYFFKLRSYERMGRL